MADADPLDAFVEGEGPALVVLGGGTYGAAALAPHARMLSDEFRVVRLQTLHIMRAERGERLPDNYSVKLESEAMARSLDRLGVDRAHVFGWSYGGLIALDFALDRPDRVQTLALFEPPAFWAVPAAELRKPSDMQAIYELGERVDPVQGPDDEQHARFLDALGAPGAQPPPPGHQGREDWSLRRLALRCLPAASRHTDSPERLKAFARPALIMIGAETVPFHYRISCILSASLPMAECAELPGAHVAPLTARDEFVARLRAFARRGSA